MEYAYLMMHYQHVYQAEHCDFLASCERVTHDIRGAQRSWTGRIPKRAQRQENAGPLCFTFPDTNVNVHLFSTCRIQVSWTDKEKQEYYEKLKTLLVPVQGYSEVNLKPLHASPRIFPETEVFRVAWCKQFSIFTRENMDTWRLIRRAAMILGFGYLFLLGLSFYGAVLFHISQFAYLFRALDIFSLSPFIIPLGYWIIGICGFCFYYLGRKRLKIEKT